MSLRVTTISIPPELHRFLEKLVAEGVPRGGLRGFLDRVLPVEQRIRADRASAASAALACGTVEAVVLEHLEPPILAHHEHGVLVFVSSSDDTTLMFDATNVEPDPRWTHHEAGTLLRKHWRWFRVAGLEDQVLFTTEGEPVASRATFDFHDTALEHELTEKRDWPGDEVLLPFSLAEIEHLGRAGPKS